MTREEEIDQAIQQWSEYYGVEFSAEAGNALAKAILARNEELQRRVDALTDAAKRCSYHVAARMHDLGDTDNIRRRDDYSLSQNEVEELCDEIDRLRGMQTPPQGKTVRVKVAVGVDVGGYWRSEGWATANEDKLKQFAMQQMSGPFQIYWLTADLPVPEEVTVEAEVENG